MSEVLIIITILIISSIIMAIIKKNIFIKVYNSLNTEDYDSFFKYVDSRLARAMMPIYTREILKLSAYIKTETNQGVTNQFNQMMKMNLTTYQLSDILVRGFNYYCNPDQINRCKKIVSKMAEVFDERELKKYQRHYDILMNGSTKYINELENELEKHRGKKKGYLEYLLAKSYQTKNNQKDYLKYLNRAMEDYQTNVQELERTLQVM